MRAAWALVAAAACGGNSAALDAPPGGDDDAAADGPAGVVEPIHLYGRWDATMSAGWPGAAIVTRFSGTQLVASLRDTNDDYLEVTVDGQRLPAVHLASGTQMVTLATGLADGEHDIAIVKRTESYVGTLRFDGFVGATLVPTPRKVRMIEFIGDSITAGYGVLGTNPCGFSDDTEAETRAWGALAAADLDAAHLAIAYSGIGMSRNYGGSTQDPMPVRYLRTFADQAGSAWDFHVVPDVVVIGLGTNDFSTGDPGQAYVDAYEQFITDAIRSHAPGVPVLLATSPMLGGAARTQMRGHLDAIAAHFADPTIAVVEIAEQQQADGLGCDYHPSEATQRKMANALVPAVRAATGW